MRWSWRLGRIAGIEVQVHATFLLLVGWVALASWLQTGRVEAVVEASLFILVVFGCIVLHELGHALTARRFGITTRDITLWPIGGVSRLDRVPEKPIQEAVVALAGPAVNLAIAAGMWLVLGALGAADAAHLLDLQQASFWERLLVVNALLALFNLLPAFPMDGGRVLRAALASRMSYSRATEIAAYVGQGMAFVFGMLGLLGNPFLLFIAFFVWMAAAGEASVAQMRSAFEGIPIHRAMIRDFDVLAPDDRLERAVRLTLDGTQQDFPVVAGGRVLGILRQNDLLAGLSRGGSDALVQDSMCVDFEPVHADEMLDGILGRLESRECRTLPVLQGDRLVGLLTMGNLGEFVRIHVALARRPRRAAIQAP